MTKIKKTFESYYNRIQRSKADIVSGHNEVNQELDQNLFKNMKTAEK